MKARRGVIPLVLALVGVVLMAWSFTAGISAALDGAGAGSSAFQIIFIAAGVLVFAAVVFAVIQLVRGGSKALGIATIVVALVPLASVIALLVTNR